MLWKKRDNSKHIDPEKRAENALINAKNRQIKALELMCESQAGVIESYAKTMKKYSQSINETKIVDAVIENAPMVMQALGISKFAVSKETHTSPDENQKTLTDPLENLESGKRYSDDQIIENLNKTPKWMLKGLVSSGKENFNSQVKSNVPNISDESLDRAFELAKVVMNE